jgi:hypothetical protein
MEKFTALTTEERSRLSQSIRRNMDYGKPIRMNPRDTSFLEDQDSIVTDEEVIAAIQSVPCHYSR